MQILQRSFMVLLEAFFLMFLVDVYFWGQSEKGIEQWEEIQLERFLYQICEKGNCTYDEYLLYQKAMNMEGTGNGLIVKEYQKEWDLNGNTYWYLVTWEEIKEKLLQGGKYNFQEGSAVEIYVITEEGKRVDKHSYSDVVRRKDR